MATALAMKQNQSQPPGAVDDAELVAAWHAGDERAFAVLYERYRERVTSYAWRMLKRREEAEEVCTDAFCRVVEGRWKPTGSFTSYLFTVVHRLCLDRIRRRSRGQRVFQLLRFGHSPVESPEDVFSQGQQKRSLEAALEELPEEHRATVLLYYGQELCSKEVATALGCSDQQVRSRLSYARRKLRTHMLPSEESDHD